MIWSLTSDDDQITLENRNDVSRELWPFATIRDRRFA